MVNLLEAFLLLALDFFLAVVDLLQNLNDILVLLLDHLVEEQLVLGGEGQLVLLVLVVELFTDLPAW